MSRIPIYSLEIARSSFAYGDDDSANERRRDPRKRRACTPSVKVPIYRVVLRKDGTLRVPHDVVDAPLAAHQVAYALIGDRPFEHLVAIFLNGQNRITGATIVATAGHVSSSPATVRGVFTGAIVHNASGIVLAHNHPSGNPTPSDDDVTTTEKMQAGGVILGIPIVDHLVITRDPNRWRSILCHT